MSQVNHNSSVSSRELVVPATVYPYRVGVAGGVLGGLAMVAVALVYGLLTGRLWLPINLIGATVVRDLQSASMDTLLTFNAPALFAGLAIHFVLSVGLGFVFALLLPTLPGPPIIWSLIIGPMLWAVATIIGLPIVNPLMAENVDVPSFFVAHLVYGLVLGWRISRSPKIPTR